MKLKISLVVIIMILAIGTFYCRFTFCLVRYLSFNFAIKIKLIEKFTKEGLSVNTRRDGPGTHRVKVRVVGMPNRMRVA